MFTCPKDLPVCLMRVALAFCFLSFGIWELIEPQYWIDYVPAFVANILPAKPLVFGHGISLSIIALGVLSGKWPRVWTGLATLMLLEICIPIGLSEGFSPTFIRDVSLLLFSGALFAQSWTGART